MGKKILFMANILSLGGLEKVMVTIANALSVSENITLYSLKGDSFGYEYKDNLHILYGGNLKKNAIKHPLLTSNALFNGKLYQKKKLNFKQIEKDINFLEYNTIILSEADILYASQIKEVNPNITIIGWIHNTFESYRDTYMKDSYAQFIDSLLYVDTLIVLTKSDRAKYNEIHPNVVQIYNPLTIEGNSSNKVRIDGKKIISFVGRLSYHNKGLDYIIELMKYIPEDWIISIAGDGPDREKLEQEIRGNELQHRMILNGVLKGDALSNHYLNSSIFILTSRWEGFGLVITEAMSNGLPVIAFDSYGPREILGENNEYGILVENGNVKKLASAVNNLIEDKEIRQLYSEKALQRAKDYQIEKIIQEWLPLL